MKEVQILQEKISAVHAGLMAVFLLQTVSKPHTANTCALINVIQ